MKTMKSIIIENVKSNQSNAKVWRVSIPKRRIPTGYCKNAASALKYAFLLKAKTGLPISDSCMQRVMFEIAKRKSGN